jgi:uncharacterized repeat protein (TIGR03809 family)
VSARLRPFFFLAGWFMTHRTDEAPRREVIARWCTLAEQRLDYLTDMFESGRWRRYYSEHSFLENIQEAKFAVNNWRALSLGQPITPRRTGFMLTVSDGQASLEPADAQSGKRETTLDELISLAPSIETMIAHSEIVVPETIVASQRAPASPHIDMAALEEAIGVDNEAEIPPPVYDLDAIERRYPALRHVL